MNLYGLLGQVTSPDTQAIAQATATLTKLFWQQPTCIPALLQILLSPANQVEQPSGSAVDANATAIRQLAAVELRKRILMDGSNIVVGSANSKLWTALPKAVQDQFKADILAYIPSERSYVICIVKRHPINSCAIEHSSGTRLPRFCRYSPRPLRSFLNCCLSLSTCSTDRHSKRKNASSA